jgi:signal transduction histidine kinase
MPSRRGHFLSVYDPSTQSASVYIGGFSRFFKPPTSSVRLCPRCLIGYDCSVIDAVRRFFEINTIPVFFLYGQVFFVLGLAIALRSRRHTRLELARSLSWLAAFGIIHGIHEWGTIFIPIQATYVNDRTLTALQLAQLLSLALSFAFLFQFGSDLFRERWPRISFVPLLMFAGWSLIFLLPQLLSPSRPETWVRDASIWARYLLGLPGGLLAAWGLRYQAERQIKPLNLSTIYRTLLVAGLALGAYAILAGAVVSAADFFPSNLLNGSLLVAWIGVPPPVLRSLAGLIMAVTFIRALDVFDVEIDTLIEKMQVEQSLTAERERISRDLHDGAIQQMYTAGLIVESASRQAGHDDRLGNRLQRAMVAVNEAITSLRAYMGELRPGPSTTPLATGLRRQTADPSLNALMNVELELDLPETGPLDPVQTTRVLAILGEALANAARHAGARQVTVRAARENGEFILSIDDDGCGFDSDPKRFGYGLRDMRDRARLLGGQLTIESEPGRGTKIQLNIPVEQT